MTSENPRLHPLLGLGALTAVFLLIAILGARQTGGTEMGFHLLSGEGILEGKGLPREESLSFASSGHDPIDTSWGYELLAALVHGAAGPAGLTLLHAAAIVAAFLILGLTARLQSANPLPLALLLLLGALASEPFFEGGPALLSWLLLAITIHLLHRYAAIVTEPSAASSRRDTAWLLAALPLLQLVWVNVHALFVLGWLAMGCFVAGLWIAKRAPDLRLAAWSGASIAATLINPHGWRGVAISLTPAGWPPEGSLGAPESLLASPFALIASGRAPAPPGTALLSYLLLFLLSFVALAGVLRQRRARCALLWIPFLILSARMVRHVPHFVIASLPWMASRAGAGAIAEAATRLGRVRLDARRAKSLLAGGAAACILVTLVLTLRVATDAHYIAARRLTRTGLGWNRLTLPVEAAEYASRAGLDKVRVLNHPVFGSWLAWRLAIPVYTDARLEAVDPELERRSAAAFGTMAERDAEVERFGLQWMIFPHGLEPKLVLDVSEDPAWVLVHLDQLAAVFARVRPAAQTWMDPNLVKVYEARASAPAAADLPGIGGADPPGPLATWWSGIWRRQEYPSDDRNIGSFHYARGEIDHAAARFSMAIARSGGAYYEIYGDLGSALFYMGEYRLARQALAVVIRRDPKDPLATKRLEDLASRPDI